MRIDVNSVGLLAHASSDRSNLPSASLHQWLVRFAPPRLQWLGRSGIEPDSHTTPSGRSYTARERNPSSVKAAKRECRWASYFERSVRRLEKSYPASNASSWT